MAAITGKRMVFSLLTIKARMRSGCFIQRKRYWICAAELAGVPDGNRLAFEIVGQ